MENEASKPRIVGIGGIFFKSQDPAALKRWYTQTFGMETDQWGTNFKWYTRPHSEEKGHTQWSPMDQTSEYLLPSPKDFMINYRVVHIEKLVEQLKAQGVTILDEIETYDYGKFVHVLDLEGNKIELWEPNNEKYDQVVQARVSAQ